MLRLFGGGKPDHPLADPKEAKRIFDTLPADDPAQALEELEHWLDSVSEAEGFRPEQRLSMLFMVDEAGQPRVRRLVRDYLAAVRPSKFQENRLWHRIHEYHRHAADAYTKMLSGVSQDAKGAASIKSQTGLLFARALRNVAQRLKWIQFRYGPTDMAVWGQLNLLYAQAERAGHADATCHVYACEAGASAPRREFLKAVLFGASSPDGLLPPEVDFAERLIAEYVGGIALAEAPAPQLTYWTDISQAMRPLRIARTPVAAPGLRCFGAAQALSQLQAQIERVQANRQLPAEPLYASLRDVDMALDVMRHLALYWSPQPPERKSPRHSVKSRLTVTYGLTGVTNALGSGNSNSLDFDASASESWIVENVSAGGFGAVVPQIKGDWLKVGTLLAMQPEGGTNWLVGIVRRVSKTGNQQARVGIQTLSRTPQACTFGNDASFEGEAGILLRPLQSDAVEVLIALRSGAFVPGLKLELEQGARFHMFLPQALVERGEDCELARFREMIRE